LLHTIFEVVVGLLAVEGLRSLWAKFKEWRDLRGVKKRIVSLRELEEGAARDDRK
jgi:hypothetical protein